MTSSTTRPGLAPDLVLSELRPAGDRIICLSLDGRFAIAAGDRGFATTDGRTFRDRPVPGRTRALAAIDGALYCCGGPFAVSRDRGQRWQELPLPGGGLRFCIHRDARGGWWIGCDRGVVLTSPHPERGWKEAGFRTAGRTLAITEVDGALLLAGTAGGGAWDGARFRPFAGFRRTDTVTRIARAPSGALIAVGHAGLAARSTDGGASWAPVLSGVEVNLEDCAWVAGALLVVGGRVGTAASDAALLRSTDDGATFAAVPAHVAGKLAAIASWGDGALIASDGGGLWRLAAPGDTYWEGATDDLAPRPPPAPEIDRGFAPRPAAPPEERERLHARLLAEALELAEAASAERRAARPPDADPALARLIDDAPDGDASALQVYADWLQGRGDPRGELAALQLQLAAAPERAELDDSIRARFARHAHRLLGRLEPYQDLMTLVWRAGFLHTARVANRRWPGAASSRPPPADLEEVLAILLDAPSARFLRELTVGIVSYEDNTYDGVAERLGERLLPSLRALFLGDFHSEETELNWSSLGDVAPIYAAAPNLRALKLRSGRMHLGAIVLPRLERFEVVTGGLDREAARAIASARWPGLRALSIQVGPARHGEATARAEDLAPVLEGAGLPRLVHLGLTNLDYTDALIEPLAHGEVLPPLEELDLKMGPLSDDGARLLYRYQRAFAHLRRIDVDDNYLTADGLALLASTGLPLHFGEQRDDDGDPEDRYASAYE